jgi:hypothetical protein
VSYPINIFNATPTQIDTPAAPVQADSPQSNVIPSATNPHDMPDDGHDLPDDGHQAASIDDQNEPKPKRKRNNNNRVSVSVKKKLLP